MLVAMAFSAVVLMLTRMVTPEQLLMLLTLKITMIMLKVIRRMIGG